MKYLQGKVNKRDNNAKKACNRISFMYNQDKSKRRAIMKIRFQRLLCYLFGHKYYSVVLDNGAYFDGVPRSFFGIYHCQRCGHEENWSYDI